MAKFSVVAGVALALVAGSALAADLPSRKAAPPAFVPPPPPFSWTGLYGGVNIGYGFGAGGTTTGAWGYVGGPGLLVPAGGAWGYGPNLNGVTGGGQIGYNFQFSPWLVVGAEADIQAADINSKAVAVAPVVDFFGPHIGAVNAANYVDWWGTVRGRLGLTLPSFSNLMIYGTGGFAYGGVNRTVSVVDTFPFAGAAFVGSGIYNNTSTGWTAGGGVEWTPTAFPAWSLKVEYLYTDLGPAQARIVGANGAFLGGGPLLVAQDTASTRFHSVRAGLNWHFNPFGAGAPVLAKY